MLRLVAILSVLALSACSRAPVLPAAKLATADFSSPAAPRRIDPSDWRELLALEGQNLWWLDAAEEETKAQVRSLSGKFGPKRRRTVDLLKRYVNPDMVVLPNGGYTRTGPNPWFLWKIEAQGGRTRYLLFEGWPLWSIPGESEARVNLISEEGDRLWESTFETGYRILAGTPTLLRETRLGVPLIEIPSLPQAHGLDIGRQYYALAGDSLALVRLEDTAGHAIRNHLGTCQNTVGPFPPRRSAVEWEAEVCSVDTGRRMAALLWLGALRACPYEIPETFHHRHALDEGRFDDLREAELAESVRGREEVRRVLDESLKSDIPWVREAAEMARTPEYYD
ncbi:MAG: hypothetical protein HYY93_08655 [Planctomycetes bacterium]|nr:hypothetical protein [Planctomycetota bacterium]